MEKKIVATLILLMLMSPLIQISAAQEEIQQYLGIESISVTPERLFVGDYAELKVTLYNSGDTSVRVSSVQIWSSGISSDFMELGSIPPKSSYTLIIPIKAEKPGAHNVELKIYTDQGLIKGYFTVFVMDENTPKLSVDISTPYTSAVLYDVLPISLELTNLKGSKLYDIEINASSDNGKISIIPDGIPILESGETEELTLYYSPERSGKDEISIKISYRDELGNKDEIVKNVSVYVQNKSAVDVSGVEIESKVSSTSSYQPRGGFFGAPSNSENFASRVEITVSGEVINRGITSAKSVLVYLDFGNETEEYYIGEMEPSDSDSFSIPASGTERSVLVVVEWINELGEAHKISRSYQLTPASISLSETPPRTSGIIFGLGYYQIAIISLAVLFGFLIYLRRRRGKR